MLKSMFSRARLVPVAVLGLALVLGACGGGSSDNAASSSTSSSSSTTSSSSSTTASSSSDASTGLPAGVVACNLFNLSSLNSATNLTWTVADATSNDACTITADNGNTVAIKLVPTQGQNDQVLPGAKSACDAGSFQEQQVIDGGYVCTVSGVASAGALFKADNVFVAISAKTFNGASTSDVQSALLEVLKSFVAPK